MSNAVFGKAISRSFIADDGSQYLTLPSQSPTIYLFPYGTQPSRAVAAAGTGAVQTISTWTQTSTAELTYSFAAVVDPEPNGELLEREYWEAINYVLATSGQVQTKIRMFCISRADVLESIPGLTSADVAQVWPGVTSYITSSQLVDFLPLAEAEMRREIGIAKWPRLSKLADTKICLAYKAIEMMAACQVVKGNSDKFVWMVDYFKDKYLTAISKINLTIDLDGDGKPDAEVTPNSAVVFSLR